LTLTTLAALVPDDVDAEIEIVDEGVAEIDPDLETDLVGMTVITGTANRAYELAAVFRGRGIPVVLGGPHVTLTPEDAAPHCDSVVVGYAEDTWPDLLHDFAGGCLQARYDQKPDHSLAGMPQPRLDLLPKKKYLTDAVFEATRACVHACEFCVVPSAWGRTPLQKPVPEVIDAIMMRGARRIIFVDLNLVADPDYAAELFEGLLPLDVTWFGLATTRLADDDRLLELAARSGCRGILMGVESMNPKNMGQIRKGWGWTGSCRELVEKLHRHRIGLQACFVFGLDSDTIDVFEKTARMAIEAGIDLPRFAVVTPFPGTPLYRKLDEEDRIFTKNWDLYDSQHVVFHPAHMSAEELARGTERAWKMTYSLSGIARRIVRTASPFPVALAANIGYRFYARNLKRFYQCDWCLEGPCSKTGLPAWN
jgi:radical SAM superfamily enzyme YgiQ (UPF0313 family)